MADIDEIDEIMEAAGLRNVEDDGGGYGGRSTPPAELLSDAASEAKRFNDALRPDEPHITAPVPGDTTLLVGALVDGELYKYAHVRELRGSDEEVMSKLDRSRPGRYMVKLEDMVLNRAVETIGPFSPKDKPTMLQDLLIGDRGALFMAVLLATYGETKEYSGVICTECGESSDIEIDIPGIVEVKEMKTTEPFVTKKLKNGRMITVRYPTGADQMHAFQTKDSITDSEMNTLMLSRCIVNDDIPDRHKYALELGIADRRTLVNAMLDGAPAVSFKEVSVPCPSCNEPIPFTFGWADLLFG